MADAMTQENRDRPTAWGVLTLVGLIALLVVAGLAYVSYWSANQAEEADLSVDEISFLDEGSNLDSPYEISISQLESISENGEEVFGTFDWNAEGVVLVSPVEVLENEELSLSSSQRQSIETIRDDTAAQAADLTGQIVEKEQQLQASVLDDGTNNAEVATLAEESGDLWGQLRGTVLQSYLEVVEVLDKEQLLLITGE